MHRKILRVKSFNGSEDDVENATPLAVGTVNASAAAAISAIFALFSLHIMSACNVAVRIIT
jgi:hypothetical protein